MHNSTSIPFHAPNIPPIYGFPSSRPDPHRYINAPLFPHPPSPASYRYHALHSPLHMHHPPFTKNSSNSPFQQRQIPFSPNLVRARADPNGWYKKQRTTWFQCSLYLSNFISNLGKRCVKKLQGFQILISKPHPPLLHSEEDEKGAWPHPSSLPSNFILPVLFCGYIKSWLYWFGLDCFYFLYKTYMNINKSILKKKNTSGLLYSEPLI